MTRVTQLVACVVVFVGTSGQVQAAPIVTPAGLSPGDTYHFVFVTEGTRDATSGAIGVYNDFVQAEAERAGAITATAGLTWSAIATTPAVDARDNAVVSAPVFRLDGTQVAAGFADIWDGSIAAAISIDQFGGTSTNTLSSLLN